MQNGAWARGLVHQLFGLAPLSLEVATVKKPLCQLGTAWCAPQTALMSAIAYPSWMPGTCGLDSSAWASALMML